MTDKTAFTDEEWVALSEAPLLIAMALAVVGPHGPISMVKESAALAKAIAAPPDHGAANILIAQIAEDAKGKQARHDAKHHKAATAPATVDLLLEDVALAAPALAKADADEAAGVRSWYVDIATAVAAASKGVSAEEQAVVDRVAALFA